MERMPYIFLLSIIILSSLLNFFALREGHSWGDDFALYIAQAKSLVEGTMENLHHQNTFAMSHSTYPTGPNLYPWGFPIILSPIYAVFGLDLLPMKIIEIFFFELSLVVLFYLFLGKLDNILTLLLVAFFAFNPFFLLLNDHLISDIPYLFFSLISIFMIEKIVVENKSTKHKLYGFILIGYSIFLSYSVRTIGFILVVLLFGAQIISTVKIHPTNCIRHAISNKLSFLPYGIIILSSLSMRLFLPSGSESYLSYLPHINLTLIKSHLNYYVNLPSDFFAPYFAPIIYGATIPFIVSGISRNFRENYLYLIYSALILVILILIPFIQGLRYILPIFPFYIYFFCVGLKNSYFQFSISLRYFTLTLKPSYIFMIIVICSSASYSVRIAYSNFNNEHIIEGPFTEQSIEMFNFISNYTNKDDIIVFFKPRILSLLTGRRSIMALNLAEILKNGDYLVIHKGGIIYDQTQLSPSSEGFLQITQKFPIIFENVDFSIFRLNRHAEAD